MSTSPLPAGWGRHLEDELVGVAPILLYVASHAPGESPTGAIRGRSATLYAFTSQHDFEDWAAEIWSPDRAVFGRQVPALRFDTLHGSVVVADVWDDTGFEFLHRRPGNRTLKVHTPLAHVAGWISRAERTMVDDEVPVFAVHAIGWTETEPMPPRARFRAFASYATDDGFAFVNDGNEDDRSGVRGVIRAFKSVNTKEVREEAGVLLDRSRASTADLSVVDVHRGIAAIERFLTDS